MCPSQAGRSNRDFGQTRELPGREDTFVRAFRSMLPQEREACHPEWASSKAGSMPPRRLWHEVRGLGPAMCDCNERTHTHTLTGERRRVLARVDADGPHEGRAWLNGCRGAPSEVRHRCAARHTVGLSTYTPDGDVCARRRGREVRRTGASACGDWRRKSGRIRGGRGFGRHFCARFRGCPCKVRGKTGTQRE